MALLSVQQLVKRYGGLLATDHFDFNVEPGELHAIIGPNGAGKSTLIAQLAGDVRPDSGQIRILDHDISRLKAARRALMGLARRSEERRVGKEGFSTCRSRRWQHHYKKKKK